MATRTGWARHQWNTNDGNTLDAKGIGCARLGCAVRLRFVTRGPAAGREEMSSDRGETWAPTNGKRLPCGRTA